MHKNLLSSLKQKLITIHIGARNPIRSIPFNLQCEIIEYINNNYKLDIYILGDDKELINKLKNKYNYIKYKNVI